MSLVGTGPTESLGHVPCQTAHAASSVGGASESTTSEDVNYFDSHSVLHKELCKY